jgi:hypothetical protein
MIEARDELPEGSAHSARSRRQGPATMVARNGLRSARGDNPASAGDREFTGQDGQGDDDSGGNHATHGREVSPARRPGASG